MREGRNANARRAPGEATDVWGKADGLTDRKSTTAPPKLQEDPVGKCTRRVALAMLATACGLIRWSDRRVLRRRGGRL